MALTYAPDGVHWLHLPTEWFELVPIFCAECARPIGQMAVGLLRHQHGVVHCSNACRVLAEWHAPERR